MKYCAQCETDRETYWELDCCDKNPEGVIPEPMDHGNIINGTVTCDDDYCHPRYEEVDSDQATLEYISTHEVHERCSHCHQFMECM